MPDDLADLLGELDDRMLAMSGPSPSARARALLEVALARHLGHLGEPSPALLDDLCGAPQTAAGAAVGSRVYADVCAYFESPSRWSTTGRQASVPLAVSAHSHGEIVQLYVVERPGRAVGVAPDLLEAPFQRFAAETIDALIAASEAAGVDRPVRFSILSARTGLPLDALQGRSVGLGAAIAFRRIVSPRSPAPDPSWVFTGDVTADGDVGGLAIDGRPGAYVEKVSAADARCLVVPRVDLPVIEELLRSASVPAIGVDSIDDAEGAIERHRLGVSAYELATDPTKARLALRQRRRRQGAACLLAAVVGLLVAGWLLSARRTSAERAERAEAARVEALKGRAWGDVVDVVVPSGSYRIQQNEVSNEQYLICLTEAPDICDPPAGNDPSEPSGLLKPVRGASPSDMQEFCEWLSAQASLPSFDLYVELSRLLVDHEFPVAGDRGLQPAEHEGIPDDVLNNIAGNVSEVTSSTCTEDFSVCRPRIRDSEPIAVFGASFDSGVQIDGWPDLVAASRTVGAERDSESFTNTGFRCAVAANTKEATSDGS